MVRALLLKLKKLHPYICKDVEIEIYSSPYPHIIIKNLLNQDIYQKLCLQFSKYIGTLPPPPNNINNDPLIYDFLIYTMKEKDCFDGYDFFISEEWHTFVSNLFNININKYIAYTLHYHKAPSKNGFAHLDLNLCTAKKDPLKKIKIINDCDYANDTAHNEEDLTKIVRSVSAIYYLNNPDNISIQDGGGTGIYRKKTEPPIKYIQPLNNSFFIFETGTRSLHSYIGTEKFDRCAMVQWFHEDAVNFIKRNFNVLTKKEEKTGSMFERWKKNEPIWDYKLDDDYKKFFN
jgi:hypothetical protein